MITVNLSFSFIELILQNRGTYQFVGHISLKKHTKIGNKLAWLFEPNQISWSIDPNKVFRLIESGTNMHQLNQAKKRVN